MAGRGLIRARSGARPSMAASCTTRATVSHWGHRGPASSRRTGRHRRSARRRARIGSDQSHHRHELAQGQERRDHRQQHDVLGHVTGQRSIGPRVEGRVGDHHQRHQTPRAGQRGARSAPGVGRPVWPTIGRDRPGRRWPAARRPGHRSARPRRPPRRKPVAAGLDGPERGSSVGRARAQHHDVAALPQDEQQRDGAHRHAEQPQEALPAEEVRPLLGAAAATVARCPRCQTIRLRTDRSRRPAASGRTTRWPRRCPGR